MRRLFAPPPKALVVLILFTLLTLLPLLGSPPLKAAQSQQSAAQTAQRSKVAATDQSGPPPGATYVGSDTCKGCHEEVYSKHFAGTPHFALSKKAGMHGCEDCHGPGSAHVEGGGDVSKINRFTTPGDERSTRLCLTCHAGSSERANFQRSSHFTNDVGCTTCHSPHKASVPRNLLRNSQPQLCYGCHTDTRAEFDRPFRHRVNEGLIQCNDCHNVHGTLLTRQLRATPDQNMICMKCHTDTRGPYVYEHLPVKTEGCVSCHMPHGSPNQRLLRVSQVNTLCLQCHTLTVADTPSQPPIGPAHNQAAKYQACTMCHAYIHGSNFSEVFFKP